MKAINVVAAIIVKDNKIFATQRGYGEYKGWWEFPGGKIEPGESYEVALTREIKEELDIEISVGKFLTMVEYDYPKFHLIMHCYVCALQGQEPVLLEHDAAKWLGLDEIDSVKWLAADIEVIEAIRESNILTIN